MAELKDKTVIDTEKLVETEFKKFTENQKDKFQVEFMRAAYERYRKLGLPHKKHEDYKYFPVYKFFPENPSMRGNGKADVPEDMLNSIKVDDKKGIHLVFLNGNFSEKHSDTTHIAEGVEFDLIRDLSDKKKKEIFSGVFETQNINKDAFVELNSAFLDKGFVIRFNHDNPPPVYCYYISSKTVQEQVMNFRAVLIVEKDRRADFSEIYFSKEEQGGFENYLTEIFADRGAKVNSYRIQDKAAEEIHVNNTQIYQKESSNVNTFNFIVSGKKLRNNLNFILDEELCESHLYGVYHVINDDLIDNHTTVDHKKPNCFSNENYKGILDNNGKGVFNGKIYVRPNAQKTNAFQSNKNIVLTDTASINTKPQLEIWADDVKCSHGATTGQIDEEQMFYLRSRGLDEQTAKALLLHAFAFEIVEKIDLEPFRNYIGQIINKRLGHQFTD